MPSGIVYNLSFDTTLQVYLPSVYVAHFDRNGQLGYMEKRGTLEILKDYGFYQEGSEHLLSLNLCKELDPENLKSRFVKSKKLTLSTALENATIKKSIMNSINSRMDKFLQHVSIHNFPICHNIDRKIPLEGLRLKIVNEIASPKLKFSKTKEGIDYTLAIRRKNIQWYPSEREVTIICDQPGWIIENGTIYQLENLNGNKLKPFLQKKTIHIPNRITHTYLEKFVKDIIAKASVSAEGFEILSSSENPRIILKSRKNFISDDWVLEMFFDYGNESFPYRIPESLRTRLKYTGQHDVQFLITERQEELENKYIQDFEKMGLSLNPDKYLELTEKNEDPYALFAWLLQHQNILTTKNIQFKPPTIHEHRLSTNTPQLQISQSEQNDWFDIYGIIKIGDHEVPFNKLIENIREDNRVFLLPDGTYFIIPIEWMSKYKGLARWAKEKGNGVQILRSQYTLLEEQDKDENNSMAILKVIDNPVDFKPPEKLLATLRPYQMTGAQWLISHQEAKLGCCLADDMGLGKTIQTLCALLYAKENLSTEVSQIKEIQMNLFEQAISEQIQPLRSLIIMPASLIFNWNNEIKKFTPHLITKRHIGPKRTKNDKEFQNFDIVLTSYQTALRDVSILSKINWTCIILDESQYIKNHNSKIFAAIQELPSQFKLSLSGTPIENSLSDLWSQMQFINPEILGTYSFFKKHFQRPIEKYQDEFMLEELKQITQPYILRRTKESVLTDLPEKTEHIIYCEMSSEQSSLYEKEKSAARNLLIQSDLNDPQVKMRIFTSLLRLRQLANHPVLYKKDYKKSSGKFEILSENLITIRKSGHKALIFSSFTGHLDLVAGLLTESKIPYVILTGKSSQNERQKVVHSFQNDSKIPFFLISIKAGGTGLNLTAADYVFLLDPWWNPFVEKQAIARAHRIGLKHSLSVYRYISSHSIEEKILLLQQKKEELSDEMLSNSDIPNWNKEELSYLLE